MVLETTTAETSLSSVTLCKTVALGNLHTKLISFSYCWYVNLCHSYKRRVWWTDFIGNLYKFSFVWNIVDELACRVRYFHFWCPQTALYFVFVCFISHLFLEGFKTFIQQIFFILSQTHIVFVFAIFRRLLIHLRNRVASE